jgi:exosome complex RNA-binding protein Csl4
MVNIVIIEQKEKLAVIEEFSPKKSQSSKGDAIDPIIEGIISKLENIPSNTSLFKAIKLSLET